VSSAFLYLAILVMWLGVLVPMWLRRDKHTLDEVHALYVAESAAGEDTLSESTGEMPARNGTGAAAEAHGRGTGQDAPESAPMIGTPPTGGTGLPSGEAGAPTGPEPEPGVDGEAADQAPGGEGNVAPAPGRPLTPRDRRRIELRRRAMIVARRRRRLFWCVLLVLASIVTALARVIPWWGVAPSGGLLVGYLAVLRVAVKVDGEQQRRATEARAERVRRARERRARELAMQQEAEIIELAARQEEIFDQYADPPRRAVGD
jgi:hypothetical protein